MLINDQADNAVKNENLVGLGGFEPPTSPLSGVRSNQLSYRPEWWDYLCLMLRYFYSVSHVFTLHSFFQNNTLLKTKISCVINHQ